MQLPVRSAPVLLGALLSAIMTGIAPWVRRVVSQLTA